MLGPLPAGFTCEKDLHVAPDTFYRDLIVRPVRQCCVPMADLDTCCSAVQYSSDSQD
jgi:hypothetical protein